MTPCTPRAAGSRGVTGPLLTVRHTHGPDTLTVFDASVIIAFISRFVIHIRASDALKSKEHITLGCTTDLPLSFF